jgi:C-terminal processing protease CtpA/Prc
VDIIAVDPVDLPTPRKPIAVLIGPSTRNSGEAIAVALRALPDSRFFGARSAGLSTCNDDIALNDGAHLFLTTGVYVDRTGRQYPNGLSPDVSCGEDETMATAQAWIESMPPSRMVGV